MRGLKTIATICCSCGTPVHRCTVGPVWLMVISATERYRVLRDRDKDRETESGREWRRGRGTVMDTEKETDIKLKPMERRSIKERRNICT